jgi:hypothetical protein
MPTDTYKVLYTGQLAAAAASLYTPGTGKQAIVKNITLQNLGANTETVTLYINGTAVSNKWSILALSPTGTDGASAEWDGTISLANTDSIQGFATDATAVTCIFSGDEIS